MVCPFFFTPFSPLLGRLKSEVEELDSQHSELHGQLVDMQQKHQSFLQSTEEAMVGMLWAWRAGCWLLAAGCWLLGLDNATFGVGVVGVVRVVGMVCVVRVVGVVCVVKKEHRR